MGRAGCKRRRAHGDGWIPIRNMHSPVEILDLKDVQRLVRWLSALAGHVDADFVEKLAYRLPDFEEPA